MAYIIVGTIVAVMASAIAVAINLASSKRSSRQDGAGNDAAEAGEIVAVTTTEERDLPPELGLTEVLLGSSRDHPAIRISTLEPPYAKPRGSLPKDGISRLNSLIGACGPLATRIASGGNLMRVDVAGPLARAAGTDGFRGYVIEGGRIVEHAVLDPSSIASVATGAFVFQIVSIVVAQKHLADIDRRLQDLQTAVGGLQDYLEDGRRAQITGAMRYLRQLAALVLSGQLGSSERFQLERLELDLMQIQDHLASSMDRAREALDGFKGSDWVGSLEISNQIELVHTKVETLGDEWMMAHAARIAALQLLSATDASAPLVDSRRIAITDDLDAFTRRRLPDHRRYFQSKIPLIESWFNSSATLDKRRSEASCRMDVFLARMQSGAKVLRSEMTRQARLAAEIEAPLSIGLELNDGQVTRAFALPREPMTKPSGRTAASSGGRRQRRDRASAMAAASTAPTS